MHNQRVMVQKVKIRKNKELVRTHKNRAKKKNKKEGLSYLQHEQVVPVGDTVYQKQAATCTHTANMNI